MSIHNLADQKSTGPAGPWLSDKVLASLEFLGFENEWLSFDYPRVSTFRV